MISKGYLYYLVWVKNSSFKTPTVDSVAIVSEFLEDHPGVPPVWEIYFGIEFLLDNHPNSIRPFTMAPTEHKDLKEQSKDLLEKGSSDLEFHHGVHQCCS